MKIADAPSTGIAWHCTSCTNTCINTTSGQIVQSQIVLVQKCIVMDFSSPAETYRRFPGLHPHPYSLSHLTWSIFWDLRGIGALWQSKDNAAGWGGHLQPSIEGCGCLLIRWSSLTLPCHAMMMLNGLWRSQLWRGIPRFAQRTLNVYNWLSSWLCPYNVSFWNELVLITLCGKD
jgi:hypothetical protein